MARDRLLIVEDEDIVRQSMARVLARAGYAVDEAPSGFEALDMIGKEHYDLVLVDIKMPRMSGIEFLERARQVDSQMAAIIITGYATMEQAVKAMELGSQGFIMKPVYPDQLIQAVKTTLHRHHVSREIQRLQAFSPFLDLSRIVLGQGDLPTMVKSFMDTVIAQTRSDQGALFLWEEDQFNVANYVGFPTPPAPPSQEALERLEQWIKQRGEAMLSGGGFLAWPELSPISDASMPVVCLPLTLQMNLLGLLVLGHRETGEVFSKSDVEFLWVMCGLLAMGLGNIQMVRRFSDSSSHSNERALHEQQLRELSALHRLLQSEEVRAPRNAGTYEQMERRYRSLLKLLWERAELAVNGRKRRGDIGEMVEPLCATLGISSEGLGEAVYLRNVGYLGATDRPQPGALTHPAKDHPQCSAEQLRELGMPESCWQAVLYHHENFDGSGFPQGLAGERIPLGARALRVLEDAHELLNGSGPSGELAEERLTLRLEQGAGTLYDPRVVKAFLKQSLPRVEKQS